MADTTTNFFINSAYNQNYDITWSFQYNVSGSNTSTGGFSTFLFNNDTLVGGGKYAGVGFAPYKTSKGVTNAVLGVIFDTSNIITIKSTTKFTTLTTIPLFTELTPFIDTTNKFNTIRFNLTNLGSILNIAIKELETNTYKTVATVNTNITANDSDFYKIGFGYSSPLKSGDPKLLFKIKDIHIHGSTHTPETTIKKPPYEFTTETNYILQSPISSKIEIGKPTPTSVGYLLHK